MFWLFFRVCLGVWDCSSVQEEGSRNYNISMIKRTTECRVSRLVLNTRIYVEVQWKVLIVSQEKLAVDQKLNFWCCIGSSDSNTRRIERESPLEAGFGIVEEG